MTVLRSTLTLYDIPSKFATSWSPNVWKSRYSLNVKGIPYKTEWIEYPDIRTFYETKGLPPNKGSFTLPVLHDEQAEALITGSVNIAKYLDYLHPDAFVLMPPGTEGLIRAYAYAVRKQMDPLWKFTIPETLSVLPPRSAEFFRRTREASFGYSPLEGMMPEGPRRAEEWDNVRKSFGTIASWAQKDSRFVVGGTVTFADCVNAAYLKYVKVLFGSDSKEWKDMTTWDEGRWGRLHALMERYDQPLDT
ncbi:hypothetical protein CYLTODRAFT_367398 [Cylindrobasidium torrendii FP15055 ss-10]|uniref:Uncharacterized protein n=1 Tax=Cylindrobasidium torrendii FP15055 ss-10 TaxID=1314674 RepID=A0A0D7BR31_9AGAR|nr:hypothetical protein CYLTODRAFT_367398 [Cylindrobasidium torrendii FP15055 ss-10]